MPNHTLKDLYMLNRETKYNTNSLYDSSIEVLIDFIYLFCHYNTVVTANEIIHFFISANFERTKGLNLVQIKSKLRTFCSWEVQTQKLKQQ